MITFLGWLFGVHGGGNYRCGLCGTDLNRQWKQPHKVLHASVQRLVDTCLGTSLKSHERTDTLCRCMHRDFTHKYYAYAVFLIVTFLFGWLVKDLVSKVHKLKKLARVSDTTWANLQGLQGKPFRFEIWWTPTANFQVARSKAKLSMYLDLFGPLCRAGFWTWNRPFHAMS